MSSEVPHIELKEWDTNFNYSVIKLSIVTVIFVGILVLLFTIGNLTEVSSNWSRYRCNPVFMPFASSFGYDIQENFNFCLGSVFKSKAGDVFAPIYGMLHNFSSILTLIIDVTLGIRKLFSNFFLSTNSFIRNVRDRIQGLLFQLRLTFLKMQTLMGRVYGSLYAMIWMGTSAITAGFSMSENKVVKFILDFCFDPATEVVMVDGTTKKMGDLRVGDMLASGKRVTSTFVFDGTRTPMVRIKDVVVSAKHIVNAPEGWIEAGNSAFAQPVSSIPRIVCVNVEGHKFVTATGLEVSDYDETESAAVIAEVQAIAETALNGTATERPGASTAENLSGLPNDYALGFDPDAEIQMDDGSWKPVRSVDVGDILQGKHVVLGTVVEECPHTVAHLPSGIVVSSAQLIFHDGLWVRAGIASAKQAAGNNTLRQLITNTAGPLVIRKTGSPLWVRDYREVPLPEMEDPYLASVTSSPSPLRRHLFAVTSSPSPLRR
jgi:hypothetical protein